MTSVPWFRHGRKETKRWLRRARRMKHPCVGEIMEAYERCVRKQHAGDELNPHSRMFREGH
jgi:hypothetical protein